MSTGTRAASAAASRRAIQELERLLFLEPRNSLRGSTEWQRKLDSESMYSYTDLRKAYLRRLQEIHPDKHKSRNLSSDHLQSVKQSFNELQAAWDKYESLARNMNKVDKGDKADANFTMFGVGCSFSDNEEERARRSEITDQACRGWFPSAALPADNDQQLPSQKDVTLNSKKIPLVDENMFVSVQGEGAHNFNEQNIERLHSRPLPTLVVGYVGRRR